MSRHTAAIESEMTDDGVVLRPACSGCSWQGEETFTDEDSAQDAAAFHVDTSDIIDVVLAVIERRRAAGHVPVSIETSEPDDRSTLHY